MYKLPRRSVFTSVLACAAIGAASVLTVAPANAVPTVESDCEPGGGSVGFAYTGEPQTFLVPAGVTSVGIAVSGAAGGTYFIPPETIPPEFPEDEPIELPGITIAGGTGAKFSTESIAVTPGDSLTVIVGGAGVDTTSADGGGTGQGGGGGSFVYSTPTTDGLIVAAGGGGGSGYGVAGVGASTSPAGEGAGGPGGAGGSDSGGGGGAGFLSFGTDGGEGDGAGVTFTSTGGTAGQAAPTFTGGTGGALAGPSHFGTVGGFGGGGGGGVGSYMGGGGGGGGGYSGGAGGAGGTGGGGQSAGGTGGTSYSLGAMTGIDTNTGNGAVTISRAVATTTFDTQGGSTAPDLATANSGCVITAPSIPTRYGYDFAGWFSAPTGGVLRDFADPVGSDSTLYAHWSPSAASEFDPELTAKLFSARPKNLAGWYRTPVTVVFTCTVHTAPLVGPCPSAVQLTSNGRGQTLARTITDTDGRVATVTVTGINIDRTAPTLRVAGVRAGATYTRAPKLVCRATDAVSGVASCRLTRRVVYRRGHLVTYAYRAVATDRAGNVRVVSGRYRVRI